MTDLTGNVHRSEDAQSTHPVDVYAQLSVDERFALRAAFLTVATELNKRIQTAYDAGRFADESALCSVFGVALTAFNRCSPYCPDCGQVVAS